MHFLRQIVHSLSQAVKRRLRQWTKLNNHMLVLNPVLDLTYPKSELVLKKHVVAPTVNRTQSTQCPTLEDRAAYLRAPAKYMPRGPLRKRSVPYP